MKPISNRKRSSEFSGTKKSAGRIAGRFEGMPILPKNKLSDQVLQFIQHSLVGAPLDVQYTTDYRTCQERCLEHWRWYGAEGTRTPYLFLAKEAFSQLNYGPGKFSISDLGFQIFPEPFFSICNRKSETLAPHARPEVSCRSAGVRNSSVGLCGLEPQTFPLSEGCSNQLS